MLVPGTYQVYSMFESHEQKFVHTKYMRKVPICSHPYNQTRGRQLETHFKKCLHTMYTHIARMLGALGEFVQYFEAVRTV